MSPPPCTPASGWAKNAPVYTPGYSGGWTGGRKRSRKLLTFGLLDSLFGGGWSGTSYQSTSSWSGASPSWSGGGGGGSSWSGGGGGVRIPSLRGLGV